MADDPTLRKRRSRAHGRGDHSLCLPGRCPAAVTPEVPSSPPGASEAVDATPGEVAEALSVWADALDVPEDDPRSPLLAAALRLARHLDTGTASESANLVRELRTIVSWIADADQSDKIDELRAKWAGRKVEHMLSAVK